MESIETRYDRAIARLQDAAQPERPAPPEFAAYLDKVRRHAYRITDEDIEALTRAGYSDDAVFELTSRLPSLPGSSGVMRDSGCCREAAEPRQRSRAGEATVLDVIRERRGAEPPDVLKTLHYRPEIFGRPYSEVLDLAMRGPSDWSVGERELFAAFVSSLNQCPF